MKTALEILRLAALAVLLAGSTAGLALAQTDPLAGHTAQAVIPDPVPGQGADFAPSAATATEAYGGPPRLMPDDPCTEYNPCALPSSAPHKLGTLRDLVR